MDNQFITTDTAENLKNTNIAEEMKTSYINYAMSVIVARALPEVRDGLKPVQRRILYAMHKLNFYPNKAYKKSARTVGEVIGRYHPHGDLAVYEAMVRLAQEFNVRYTLIDGQGNFGSIDGDSAAAMRYTESKLNKISVELLEDLDKNTINFRPTYDGSTKEPEILPSKVPILLLNGADGIAVGMATKIPPHNLNEICGALEQMIDKGNEVEIEKSTIPDYKNLIKNTADLELLNPDRFHKFISRLGIEDLLEIVKGPDFPTGAEIYDINEIRTLYETGRGRIVMKAIAKISEGKGGKYQIIITEIPYQVNKARLVSKIADLVKNKVVEGISDIRDESNKEGIRVVVDIKSQGKPKAILNRLFKYTEMQKTYNANMLALVDGEPIILNLKRFLELFIQHRQQVVIRRTEFDLAKSKEREHILEGLMIALDNLDEVINTIRSSKDSEVAKENLMKKFKLSEIQAQAILDMQLRRLAALERQKIEDEYKQILKTIEELLFTLNNPNKVLEIIKAELIQIQEKYGDDRRTRVYKHKIGEISEEDLIPKEEVIVTISEQGYIKRINQKDYQPQRRGGVGKKFMTTKEDDSVKHVLSANTHDDILFFTNRGRVFITKVYDIPEFGRAAKGQPVINLINIDQNELITSILTRNKSGNLIDEDVMQEGEEKVENSGKKYEYLFMATKKGIIKKTAIADYTNIQSNGLIAIKLNTDDELVWVKPTNGENEILLVTEKGKSIRFNEKDVRETGRATMGVIGIKFTGDDKMISMDVVRKNEYFLLTVSENGFGKITVLEQFPIQNRGGKGVFAAKVNTKTGKLIAARIIDHPDKELLLMSKNALAVKIPVKELPERNRQTSGVKLIKLRDIDKVAAIVIV
ncbi:DNA gyrase subunit A [Candidatus Dojkabacteria bacterium]|nr:DNA gyrase subunit A [Candidatus Dojkabacteria bacterium]